MRDSISQCRRLPHIDSPTGGATNHFPKSRAPSAFPSRYPRITSHCRPVVRSRRRRRRYHLSLALHRIHDPHIHRRCAMTGLSELRTKCTLQHHVIVRSGLAQQNGTPLPKPLSLQVLAPFAPPFQHVGLCIPIRTCISFSSPANGQKSRPRLHGPKKVGRQAKGQEKEKK
ncbi:hypothetical protein CMEL01_05364 [Colletotrichum melonis]|uniref:Uncharacterized protein n=1 Tax=Colletotrichum melonis TaxID=1209925 RepID=A0AAI9XMR8_9PEZI|nr:hypothetical protein CMEL01_05364 [Colletotrichum melonis]